ncbi:hypothetical protein LRQ08_31240 (plasmid) [Rhodococcus qingshengii]|uniref:hypothetical protein n=1 Tax=Rhodococcus qingshengii TaxID=334542 RepID=UPI00211354FB|nr:hypothetical protein [Rhodococcus qingshengii]UUE28415.1 hypothetical protein LRQ08_31240 [Rhodococcus qingshengii]
MQRLFRFTFQLRAPLTMQQVNLVLPAVRALMEREGLEPNYGQLDPEGEDQWMMSGWTADLDYDVFLDRYPGGSFEVWQKSVEEAKKQYGSTADLDYGVFLERYKGGSFEDWRKSVEQAIKQIVAEANPAAWVSCEWRYSDDEDFEVLVYEDACDE